MNLRSLKKKNYIYLGDVHYGEINILPASCGVGYPLIEATSSGMTHSWETVPFGGAILRSLSPLYRQGDIVEQLNFGTIDIVWGDIPKVTFSIHRVNKTIGSQYTISLADTQIDTQRYDEIRNCDLGPTLEKKSAAIISIIVVSIQCIVCLLPLFIAWKLFRALWRFCASSKGKTKQN